MSQSSRSVQLKKSSFSDYKFHGCTPDGGKVTIVNDGSKTQSLRGWRLKKTIEGLEKCVYDFPSDCFISGGQKITIVATEFKQEKGELRADGVKNWGYLGTFSLVDENDKEKCNMRVSIT